MASGMIVLGAHVKRLNWGCISCVVEIDLLIRGSTSAWVTFTGIRKEAKKRQSETVLKDVYLIIRKQIPKPSQCLRRSQAFDAVKWIRREYICHVSLVTTSHVLRIGAEFGTWLNVDSRHLRRTLWRKLESVERLWLCLVFSFLISSTTESENNILRLGLQVFAADGASIQSMPTYMKRP